MHWASGVLGEYGRGAPWEAVTFLYPMCDWYMGAVCVQIEVWSRCKCISRDRQPCFVLLVPRAAACWRTGCHFGYMEISMTSLLCRSSGWMELYRSFRSALHDLGWNSFFQPNQRSSGGRGTIRVIMGRGKMVSCL